MHLINIIDTTCKLFYFRIFEPYRILKRTKKQKNDIRLFTLAYSYIRTMLWSFRLFGLCAHYYHSWYFNYCLARTKRKIERLKIQNYGIRRIKQMSFRFKNKQKIEIKPVLFSIAGNFIFTAQQTFSLQSILK